MRRVMTLALLGTMIACASPMLAHAQNRPGIRWRENLFGAYKSAIDYKVPLVAFFYQESADGSTGYSDHLAAGPLSSPEFALYGDKAIFARVNVDLDDVHGNTKKLVDSLGIKTVPCVVVLDCRTDKIEEVGRVTGYFETPNFLNQFQPVHETSVKRIADAQKPASTVLKPYHIDVTDKVTTGLFNLSRPSK